MIHFFHGSPLGFNSNGEVAGRSAVSTHNLDARPSGIGTGRRWIVFLPLPFREVGIISRGAARSA
jgi:hypothetical protein